MELLEEEIGRLRQRVGELEVHLEVYKDELTAANKVIEERGERMKAMRNELVWKDAGYAEDYAAWFDETGEPL